MPWIHCVAVFVTWLPRNEKNRLLISPLILRSKVSVQLCNPIIKFFLIFLQGKCVKFVPIWTEWTLTCPQPYLLLVDVRDKGVQGVMGRRKRRRKSLSPSLLLIIPRTSLSHTSNTKRDGWRRVRIGWASPSQGYPPTFCFLLINEETMLLKHYVKCFCIKRCFSVLRTHAKFVEETECFSKSSETNSFFH